ncbi:MAG: alkaline phosphatase [Methylotenera sp.]|nr:alkaline phosphatase [Methylotenera sp.]
MKPPVFALSLTIYVVMLSTHCLAEDATTWRQDGLQALEASKHMQLYGRHAKNIILFLGDGMGVSTVTAARIFEGQQQGRDGERNLLSFEKLTYLAMSKTYSANQQTSDSAPTMSAIMTGVKTNDGVIGLNQSVLKDEKDAAAIQQNSVETLLELAEEHGLSTGVVTTTRVTHATPAATYAHTSSRDWENNAQVPTDSKVADIAAQAVDRYGKDGIGDGLEILFGGGRANFLPVELRGKRTDGRNLIAEYQAKFGADYVTDKNALSNINPAKIKHLLGLFDDDHMQFDTDRITSNSAQPSLMDMTSMAIDVLATNPKGYFLMVEAGRIDHAHHAGNAYRALAETVALSDAVKATLAKINLDETLIIVTADHSHTMTLSGYAKRGNPILDKVVLPGSDSPALALDHKPYTVINYVNGKGNIENMSPEATINKAVTPQTGRVANLIGVDTHALDFHQQANVPLEQETHSGEDVQIFADGPDAQLFHGVQEQSYIFYVMKDALGL